MNTIVNAVYNPHIWRCSRCTL